MTDVPDFVAGARALLAASDCTINGAPAVVVRVAELNDLVARVHRAEAAPLPSPHADVQGRCPACGCTRLLLGEGGYVTCPRIDCPEPDAASTLLEGRAADEAQGCSPACSEGHTYEAPCEQAPSPGTCVWPDCLTDGQQAELAEGVRRSMLGEATVPAPDQRRVCGCRESRTTPDNPVASSDAADNPAVAAPATPDAPCPDGTAAVPGHDWCSKAPHTVETCECGAARTAHDDRLRERVAAAIGDTDPDALDSTAAGDILGAVLAVLDDHLTQLRADLAAETALRQERTELYDTWRAKANGLAEQVANVRDLAADMRTWCSPHGTATDYAQRIDDALDTKEPTP